MTDSLRLTTAEIHWLLAAVDVDAREAVARRLHVPFPARDEEAAALGLQSLVVRDLVRAEADEWSLDASLAGALTALADATRWWELALLGSEGADVVQCYDSDDTCVLAEAQALGIIAITGVAPGEGAAVARGVVEEWLGDEGATFAALTTEEGPTERSAGIARTEAGLEWREASDAAAVVVTASEAGQRVAAFIGALR